MKGLPLSLSTFNVKSKMNNAIKKFSLLFVALLASHQLLITFGIWLPENLLMFVYGSFSFIVFGLLLYSFSRLVFSLFVRKEIMVWAVALFKSFFFAIGIFVGISIIGLTNQCTVQLDEFSQEGSANVTFTDIQIPKTNTAHYSMTIRGQKINIPVSDYSALYFNFADFEGFDGLLIMVDKSNELTVMATSMENEVHDQYFSVLNPFTTESFSTFELYDMSFNVKPSDLNCALPSVAVNYSEFIKGLTLLGLKDFTSFLEVEKVTKYEGENDGFVKIGKDNRSDLIVIKTYVPSDDLDLMINVELRGGPAQHDTFFNLVYNNSNVIESPIWLRNFEMFANKYQKGSCGMPDTRAADEDISGTALSGLIDVCKAL